MKKFLATAAGVAALGTSVLLPNAQAADGHTVDPDVIVVADGTSASGDLAHAGTPVDILIAVHKPAGASAEHPVPVILQGHGWGGSRSTDVTAFEDFLDAGYGVVSISQRGFGGSGGVAGAMAPDQEGADLVAVMDHVAGLDWVAKESRLGDDGNVFPTDDPVAGAIGGSYGGGYQYLLALEETHAFGDTRLDALAPEITWFDLNDSLAPADVPRSAWTTALKAASLGQTESYIDDGYNEGLVTGNYPAALKEEFASHGPSYWVRDGGPTGDRNVHLDIPVLAAQGFNDNLFNFNQAWHNFTLTLTDDARAESTLVGYNTGHSLPNVAPLSDTRGLLEGDRCSGPGGFRARSIEFFDAVLGGDGDPLVYGTHFAYGTAANLDDAIGADGPKPDGGVCLRFDDAEIRGHDMLLADPTGTVGGLGGGLVVAGAPVHLPIDGTTGITIGGVPTIDAELFSVGLDARVFVGLSHGTSPADARVIQGNVLPIRRTDVLTTEAVTLAGYELPGVAIELPDHEQLFLTISPVSDMYFGHGSRTPGGIGLTQLRVNLPVPVLDAG